MQPQADGSPPQPAGKPKTASANDNNAATAGQPQIPPQQPDASAMAQSLLAAQSAPQAQSPAAAANDDADDTGTTGVGPAGTAGSGKSGRGAAATDQSSSPNASGPSANDPAAGNPTTGAVAAAQAAIKDVTGQASGNSGQGNEKSSGNVAAASGSDKNAVQAAIANSASQPGQAAPIQPAVQNSMMAPGIAAASASSPGLAPHAAAAGLSTSVQINAPAAGAVPDLGSLAIAVAARSQSGARQFDIRLDPPELGRVDVRLSIDASGKTQAHMTADQPETLNLLQKDSGTLTQALRDAGLDVSQNGLNFSLRGQTGQDGGGQSRGPRQTLSAAQVIDAVQTASSISQTSPAGDGRLDIHV
jgi:flagellar hook-length control protein FliK